MTAAVPDATPSLRGPVMFWAALATLALAYLAALALNPDLVAPSRRADAAQSGSPTPPAATAAASAEAQAEIQALQQTVAALRADIAAMKAAVAAGEERERDLMARLASAERAAAPTAAAVVTGSLPSPVELAAPGAAAPASEPAVAAHTEVVSAPAAGPPAKAVAGRKATAPPAESPAPAPAKGAASARKAAPPPPAPAASASEPIGSFTASVVPATPSDTSPVSPTVISRATAYGVQLASGSSVDSLRVSWGLINERHKGLLKGLEPRYAASADISAPMTLVAGPLPTAEEAARICANLRAKRITCAVVSFDGRAL